MKKINENLHYFPTNDPQYINMQNQLIGIKSSKCQKMPNVQQKRRQNKFFLSLEDQYDELFDNKSFVSKKSRKQQKLQQKISKSSQQNIKNQHSQHILSFQDDISSISYINDQGTPNDSIFSKLFQSPSTNRNIEYQEQNVQSQISQQNLSFLASQMMQDEASEKSFFINQPSEHNQSSQIQVQENQSYQNNKQQEVPTKQGLMNKIEYAYKKSSMQFQKVNRYLLKFLRRTIDGILVLPEYSSRLQDFSQLGVEGKMLQLKVNHPKKSEMINMNLDQILSQQSQQKQNIVDDDDLEKFSDKKCFKKKKLTNQKQQFQQQSQYKKQIRQSNRQQNQQNR